MGSVNNKKEIIDDLMKKLPNNVIMYQLKNNCHIYRLNNRKRRALFDNIFSKVKIVTKVKRTTITDNLVPDVIQILQLTVIMLLKGKIKNCETLSYMDWINLKYYFVYISKWVLYFKKG